MACRLVLLAAACLLFNRAATAASPDIRQFTSTNLKTLQMDGHVITANQDVLKTIGGDFGAAYRFSRVSLTYEQPGKLHFESTVMGARIAYTINGNTRYTSVPTFHIHKSQDISGAPGKKDTLLDEGLLPPEQLSDYNAAFVKQDGADYVYALTPKLATETTRQVIWINPKMNIVDKRMAYNRDGKLTKYLIYKNAIEVSPGIYIPTRLEVYNASMVLAAVTEYNNIRVNQAVNEGVFDF
jgi:outer membrane lipoprotein-sorting protein